MFKKDHIPSVIMRLQSSVIKIPSTTLMYCKADMDQTFYYYDVIVILSVPTSRYRALSKTSNVVPLETDASRHEHKTFLGSWCRQLRSCTLRDAVI